MSKGYTAEVEGFLSDHGLSTGENLRLKVDGRWVDGVLMPGQGGSLRVKVQGYVVGIALERIQAVQVLNTPKKETSIPKQAIPAHSPTTAMISLLSTGGTIAGRPDPQTGGLVAGRSASELYSLVPELADIAKVRMRDLFSVLSEDMGPSHWVRIAQAVAEEIASGVQGIVISHGTDTLHYTAAALSFMIQNPGIPIVLVGSQKSIDRPSSDAALNLIHAAQVAANSDIAEVVVTMFGPTSDEYGLIHRGTRVRKMHTSARSTFRSIGDLPLGVVDTDGISMIRADYARRGNGAPTLSIGVDERAALLYFHPGMDPKLVDFYVDNGYRGLIVAGTGMGHCSKAIIRAIGRAVTHGLCVFMTPQTLWGSVNLYAYQTGRALLDAGVIPLGNMLPETALAKLYWALSQGRDKDSVVTLMIQPVANEIIEREPPDGYLIYQGGIPEIAEFLKKERL